MISVLHTEGLRFDPGLNQLFFTHEHVHCHGHVHTKLTDVINISDDEERSRVV
jgi:hypothetical protein